METTPRTIDAPERTAKTSNRNHPVGTLQRRDSQRSKVYASERFLEQSLNAAAMPIEACKKLVAEVLADPEVIKRFGQHSIAVIKTSGQSGRAGRRNGVAQIRLGRWSRQPHVVLHEIAHHLAGLHAQHGEHFAWTCQWVTTRFMGSEAGEALRRSYADHRVKVAATDVLSPAFSREMPQEVRNIIAVQWQPQVVRIPEHVVIPVPRPTLVAAATPDATDRTCSVEGCSKIKRKAGKCWAHRDQ